MLTIVGNGRSREGINLDTIGRWWGCNAVYRDGYIPELLFAMDISMQSEIIHSGYYEKNKVVVGGWEPIDISMLDIIRAGFEWSEEKQNVFVKEGDTHFVVQGGEGQVDFLGYRAGFQDNIVIYKKEKLKNLFTGMSALGYALEEGMTEITLLGFDALFSENVGNVYEGSTHYRYKYTLEDRVYDAQRSQFIALLEEYKNSKVYFQKSLDDIEEIDYTNLSYYENSERWILGFGLESSR